MSRNEPSPAGTPDEDAEDVRLMQLVGAGDTAAFEELVERHQRLVVGTVARMLGSNSEVEDIAQQVSCGFGKVPNAMSRGRSSRPGC